MRFKTWSAHLTVVALSASVLLVAQGQSKAELRLTASRSTIRSSESVELEIQLRNVSSDPYFVSGTIRPGLLSPYGNYDLQVRLSEPDAWKPVGQFSSDPMPQAYGRPLSEDEFKARFNLVVLEPKRFIGYRMAGTWKGLTVRGIGKYELRLVYSAFDLPIKLDKAFLIGTIVSNVVRVEVVP